MTGAALLEFAVDNVDAGQQRFADSMKRLVSQQADPIAALLDYSDDSVFLEPSLFAYFGNRSPTATFQQVLYGSVPLADRPAEFAAYADHRGTISLPNLGYLRTQSADTLLAVRPGSDSCEFEVRGDGVEVCFLHPLPDVEGTQIELCSYADSLLEEFFRNASGRSVFIDQQLADRNEPALMRALQTLHRTVPDLSTCLARVTRRIVLFSDDELESFATTRVHGTAFLNVPNTSTATEAFFVEDLAHQCGHILFSALTTRREEFLAVDSRFPLGEVTGEADEHRDVYTALHGVFTEALMSMALYACLEAEVFEGRGEHELLGRLSFIMKRFHLDMLHLHHDGIFAPGGVRLVGEFGKIFDDVYRRSSDRITCFDLSNQSYSFSYEQFAAVNACDG